MARRRAVAEKAGWQSGEGRSVPSEVEGTRRRSISTGTAAMALLVAKHPANVTSTRHAQRDDGSSSDECFACFSGFKWATRAPSASSIDCVSGNRTFRMNSEDKSPSAATQVPTMTMIR